MNKIDCFNATNQYWLSFPHSHFKMFKNHVSFFFIIQSTKWPMAYVTYVMGYNPLLKL